MKIGIVGLGRVGSNLAYAFSEVGFSLSGLWSRNLESVNNVMRNLGIIVRTDLQQTVDESDVVFISVSDDAISKIADEIAFLFKNIRLKGKVFLHVSGSKSSALLSPLQKLGAVIGSMHPIQTVPTDGKIPGVFKNICFGVEGDERAIEIANEIAFNLESMSIPIKTEGKPYYHMAACFVSNYVCAIMDIAEKLLHKSGVSDLCGTEIMAPLIYQTIDNVLENGAMMSLTGPVSRGDITTVKEHIKALDDSGVEMSDVKSMYRMLGMYAMAMSSARGNYSKETFQDMYAILMGEGEADDGM